MSLIPVLQFILDHSQPLYQSLARKRGPFEDVYQSEAKEFLVVECAA